MKPTQHKGTILFAALTACVALFSSGCGTTAGYKHADKTGAGIAEYRDEIVKGKEAIDATMKSLGEIASTANTDPRKAFDKFSSDVKKLESTAEKVAKRGASMKEKGQTYFKQWEKELTEVNNPEIRALAEKRKAKLQTTFESIRKYAEPLKEQFAPWMSDLKDLEKYLANDLTIAGVEAAKSQFSKTTKGGRAVQESMDALVAELNTIAATITPASVEAKK